MRVFHITADVAEASGVGTFVRGLDSALRAAGVESRIVRGLDELTTKYTNDTKREAEGFGQGDVVHIHGLWLGLHRRAYRWARRVGARVVWSTHGMTAPWAMRFKWWKKLPAWWLYQRWMLRGADLVHVTTEQEKEWNVRMGIKEQVVVPLGTRLRVRRQDDGFGLESEGLSSTGRTRSLVQNRQCHSDVSGCGRDASYAFKPSLSHSPTSCSTAPTLVNFLRLPNCICLSRPSRDLATEILSQESYYSTRRKWYKPPRNRRLSFCLRASQAPPLRQGRCREATEGYD